MDKHTKPDFTGQTIYIGLDVHKSSWSVSIVSEHLSHKSFTQPPEVSKLVNYLHRNFPGATYQAVYEAGFSGFWLHDQLQHHGINCTVVNPADVPTNNKEKRRKSDKVDCRKLAKRLRSHELKAIYVPTQTQMEDRGLLRTRKSMVRKQTRCKNQIIAILFLYGITIPEMKRWSGRFIKELQQIRLQTAVGNMSLQMHLDELVHLRHAIASLNKAILSLSRTHQYRDNMRLLKTIPGISTITAMTLLTELIDIHRFKKFDHLCSFVGLVPDIMSSGDNENVLGLTTRQNKLLRSMLIQSAWVATRKDPAMMLAFNRLCQRMKKTKAIVRIARKLLSRVHFVLKSQQGYELSVAA
jgi:transposase